MKKNKISQVVGSIGILLLLNACSGGGSGGNSSNHNVPSTLDKASIETFAQEALDMGSCTPISGVQSSSTLRVLSEDLNEQDDNFIARSYSIDEVQYGLVSGELHKTGQHNNGTSTMEYKFDHYTNPIGDKKIDITGSMTVVDHGKPGDYGPIMSNKTADTKTPLDAIISSYVQSTGIYYQSTGTHYQFTLNGYNRTYAKTLGDPDTIVISSSSLKDIDTGKVRTVTNFKANSYGTDNADQILTDVEAVYTDPKVGTLKLSTDNVKINKNTTVKFPNTIATTIKLVATDGTQAEAVISSSGDVKIYSVNDNNKTLISEMNCSNLVSNN